MEPTEEKSGANTNPRLLDIFLEFTPGVREKLIAILDEGLRSELDRRWQPTYPALNIQRPSPAEQACAPTSDKACGRVRLRLDAIAPSPDAPQADPSGQDESKPGERCRVILAQEIPKQEEEAHEFGADATEEDIRPVIQLLANKLEAIAKELEEIRSDQAKIGKNVLANLRSIKIWGRTITGMGILAFLTLFATLCAPFLPDAVNVFKPEFTPQTLTVSMHDQGGVLVPVGNLPYYPKLDETVGLTYSVNIDSGDPESPGAYLVAMEASSVEVVAIGTYNSWTMEAEGPVTLFLLTTAKPFSEDRCKLLAEQLEGFAQDAPQWGIPDGMHGAWEAQAFELRTGHHRGGNPSSSDGKQVIEPWAQGILALLKEEYGEQWAVSGVSMNVQPTTTRPGLED